MLGHTYGWRARLGIILPSVNVTTEPEYYRMVPEGVTLHTTRMLFEKPTEENYVRMLDDVTRGVKSLAHARVHALAFACTSGSFFGGVGYGEKIVETMQQHISCPCITTSAAVTEALKTLGIKRVCVGTPYQDWVNEIEKKFLEDSGFQVDNIRGTRQDVMEIYGVDSNKSDTTISSLVNAIPPQRVYEFAVSKVYRKDCDGIFLSCMGLPTLGVISLLERDLKKPVISSNQATLWKLLKTAGIETKGSMEQFGSLFSH